MPWKAWLNLLIEKLWSIFSGKADNMSAPSSASSPLPPLPPSPSPSAPAPAPALSPSALTHASNRTVLSILSKPGPKNRPALPTEIIFQILSDPSRWIQSVEVILENRVSISSRTGSAIVLCSPALTPKSARLLRQVVFTFKSRDQGWSSFPVDHGTYENTWTWFDAVVGSRRRRLSPETNQEDNQEEDNLEEDDGDGGGSGPNQEERQSISRWASRKKQRLQANRHAGQVAESYRFELEVGQGILENLKEGDEIALIANARFPGWVNNVEEAGLEFWEEDDLQ